MASQARRELGWVLIPVGAVAMVLATIFFQPTTISLPCTSCSALSCVCTETGPSVMNFAGLGVGAAVSILGVAMVYREARPRWVSGDWKRPTGLTVISVLWILGGLYDIQGSAFDLQAFSGTPFPLLLELALLVGSGLALGLLSVIAAAGFLTRKPWSYKLGLALLLFGLAVNAYEVLAFPYAAPFTFVFLAAALVWLAAVWTYLRRPYVRNFLGIGTTSDAGGPS